MKTKEVIKAEAKEIYFAIRETIVLMQTDYCQSWWINTKNFNLKSKLPTYTINQRAKGLVKDRYLTIDKSRTSTSTGTCYKLTDKKML